MMVRLTERELARQVRETVLYVLEENPTREELEELLKLATDQILKREQRAA